VLVLGPADAGKSSLCRVLLAAATAAGRTVAVLDTDLGQKTVGPPACVTLGRPGAGGGIELTGLAFTGETGPVRAWGRVATGGERLAAGAGADLVVADSDGLLAGPGRRLKAALIRAFGPDLLLALGEDPALEAVLADHAAVPALKLAGARPCHGGRRRASGAARGGRRSGATSRTRRC
jgi:polynucleotide 5'-hydroxyl-kinase GRC3/NOL9